MQFHAETLTADNGAAVEVATISHNGHDYTAHGSIIDIARGIAVAYIENPDRRGALTDWQGNIIGWYERTSTWTRHSRSGEPYAMTAVSATINGAAGEWHGRYGSDWSQAVTLRRAK